MPLHRQVAGQWQIGKAWQYDESYNPTGTVKAVGGKCSLFQLAYDITGHGEDWTELMPQLQKAGIPVDSCDPTCPESVPAGTTIDVAPLLSVLETRLREQVASTAQKMTGGNTDADVRRQQCAGRCDGKPSNDRGNFQ